MITVSELIQIPDDEVEWSFACASGPGGQNVNKVASKAVLRWKFAQSLASIPEPAKIRMKARFPSRFTQDGDVVIQSQKYRDQVRNREDCQTKLLAMIQEALIEPVLRKATKPSRGSKRRRLADKKKQSEKKSSRRHSSQDD